MSESPNTNFNQKSLMIVCGFCGTKTSGEVRGYTQLCKNVSTKTIRGPRSDGFLLLRCLHCNEGNLAEVKIDRRVSDMTINLESRATSEAHNLSNSVKLVRQWPSHKKPKQLQGVPLKVQTVYDQSQRLLTIQQGDKDFYEPASTNFRRTLELALKSLGRTEKTLHAKIKGMADERKIPDSMEKMATAIRLGGNEATHNSPLPSDQAKEEAVDLAEFTELFLTYAFTLPKRVEDWQKRADARKTATEKK